MRAEYAKMSHQARLIDNAIQNYNNSVKSLYEKVNTLETIWQGKDNKEYVNKINELKPSIENLGMIVNSYGILLKQAAGEIQETQEEISRI